MAANHYRLSGLLHIVTGTLTMTSSHVKAKPEKHTSRMICTDYIYN